MDESIKTNTILKDILMNFPELIDYLLEMGICGCGDDSLNMTAAEMADAKGIDLKRFLEEVNRKIKRA